MVEEKLVLESYLPPGYRPTLNSYDLPPYAFKLSYDLSPLTFKLPLDKFAALFGIPEDISLEISTLIGTTPFI